MKNIEPLEICDLKLNIDFTVISNTDFLDSVKFVYDITDQEIDVELAITLGLGVIKDINSDNMFIYNNRESDDDDDEMFRLGMYYQITHPEYDDTRLDMILNRLKGGEDYLKGLFSIPTDKPIIKLKEIFKSKKGNGNIIEFKRGV